VRDWLDRAGITSGPVFRPIDRHGTMAERRLSDQAVALIVKRAATSAGLDASGLSGHSLRAGFATSAAAVGVEERDIMKQTGHRSTAVMRRYIRGGSIFRNNAASKVGL
jgi:integrase